MMILYRKSLLHPRPETQETSNEYQVTQQFINYIIHRVVFTNTWLNGLDAVVVTSSANELAGTGFTDQ